MKSKFTNRIQAAILKVIVMRILELEDEDGPPDSRRYIQLGVQFQFLVLKS